jgi:hypothetical protein
MRNVKFSSCVLCKNNAKDVCVKSRNVVMVSSSYVIVGDVERVHDACRTVLTF